MVSIKQSTAKDKKALVVLVEVLQDYLVQIDPMHRMCRLSGYGENYIEKLLKKIKENSGAIFIAEVENIPVGFVAGIINKQSKDELLGCIPTKSGRVLELIVTEKQRGKNIGTRLMKKIEEYFQLQGCGIIQVEVFEPNKPAHNFYKKLGYDNRCIDMIKKIS